ncbi:MAG: acylphosphatase [Candidatus Anstonellales archaeon]
MEKGVVIHVYGRVQRVGYRDVVAEIGRKLGLRGCVRNLEDEVSVEIIAEGEEKQLKKFIKLINIKDYPIEVEKIEVKEKKPTRKFKYFKIIRRKPIEELGERMDVAGNLLYSMNKKLGGVDKKLDSMNGKLDSMNDKLDNFHRDTIDRFDRMEKRYGTISETLKEIANALNALAGIKKSAE